MLGILYPIRLHLGFGEEPASNPPPVPRDSDRKALIPLAKERVVSIELGKLKIGSRFKSGLGVYTLLGGVITEYEEERKNRKAKLVEAPPGFTFVQDSYGERALRAVTLVVEYVP